MDRFRSASIMIALVAAIPANAAEIDDADVRRARDALELYHIQHNLYLPVRCKDAGIDGGYFIRCFPVDSNSVGNLWFVSEGPIIYALNGKALGQLDEINGQISDIDGKPIPVRDWRQHHKPEEMPDIEGALSELGYDG